MKQLVVNIWICVCVHVCVAVSADHTVCASVSGHVILNGQRISYWRLVLVYAVVIM